LDEESKGYLDRIEEAYNNGELNKADYKELRSVVINDGTEDTVELLAEKLANEEEDSDDSSTLKETITNILNGGAAVTSKTLQEVVEKKGSKQIASVINQYIAENTPHFINLGGAGKLAGGGDSLVSMLPKVSSDAVRTGA